MNADGAGTHSPRAGTHSDPDEVLWHLNDDAAVSSMGWKAVSQFGAGS